MIYLELQSLIYILRSKVPWVNPFRDKMEHSPQTSEIYINVCISVFKAWPDLTDFYKSTLPSGTNDCYIFSQLVLDLGNRDAMLYFRRPLILVLVHFIKHRRLANQSLKSMFASNSIFMFK